MRLKRNILRVIAGMMLIGAVALCMAGCQRAADPQTYLLPIETNAPAATAAPEATAQPEPTAAPANGDETQGGEEPEKARSYAVGYVRVITPTQSGWLPLPAEEDMVFPLRQITADGREDVNMIHLTPTGVYVESANCDNQDCVKQGEVTLENMHDRVMGNAIICLPHQVYLELYSTEELLAAAAAQEEAP